MSDRAYFPGQRDCPPADQVVGGRSLAIECVLLCAWWWLVLSARRHLFAGMREDNRPFPKLRWSDVGA